MTNERQTILNELITHGFTPYICGGYPRDVALGVSSKDMDIEVYGCSISQLEAALSPFGKISTVGQRFGIVKLTTSQGEYDFSIPRRENKNGVGRKGFDIEFDASITAFDAALRRDFTFNSMFIDINGIIHDPHKGLEDLKHHRLRHTSKAFSEDPTRVLRGMRFCGQLGLRACRQTIKLCKSMYEEFSTIEADMLWAEWEKWANRSMIPSRGLEFLWSTGWIHHFPELYSMTRIPQEPEYHPEGTVWQHTKFVVDAMNEICNRDGITGDAKTILMFGALLHDVGKPTTTTTMTDENGRIVSPGHDEAGVPIALAFLERICAPKRFHEPVIELVRYHMRHISDITPKAARRFAAKVKHVSLNDWLAIVEADHSGRPPLPTGLPEKAIKLYQLATEEKENNRVNQLILGRHLIQNGFKPSPLFGKILAAVYEIQLDEGLEFDELLFIAIQKMEGTVC